jgi:hypothetical protein
VREREYQAENVSVRERARVLGRECEGEGESVSIRHRM